jgi:hypothetical protein
MHRLPLCLLLSLPLVAACGEKAANWCAASTALGSTGDFGTPGAANDACF